MAKDQNGLEKRALYRISTDIGGEKLAWTHVIPEGTPRESLGNLSSCKVELRPLAAESDETQLWQLRPGNVNPEPSYNILSKMDAYDPPNSPVRIYNIESDFSGDNDNRFHEEFNRLVPGYNDGVTESFWKIVRQAEGKFILQNFCGTEECLSKTKGSRSAWNEVRVAEAFKTTEGKVVIRQMPPSQTPGQLWELTEAGYI